MKSKGAQGKEQPGNGGGVLEFYEARRAQEPGGAHADAQVYEGQTNFAADDPAGIGSGGASGYAHGNHRSDRMGAGLQGPSE